MLTSLDVFRPVQRHGAAALVRSCTVAALLLLVCVAFLGAAGTAAAAERPDWLKKDTLDRLFPGVAAYTGLKSGKPPSFPVISAGRPIGYVFSTAEMTDIVGFSGAPFNFVVGLDMQGKIVGVAVVNHSEPIILEYSAISERFKRFVAQYPGIDPGGSISLSGRGTPGGIDGISGATVSARAFNNAIVQSARLVAHSRGLTHGSSSAGMVDTTSFKPMTWDELIAAGAIGRMQVTGGGNAGSEEVVLDLYAAVVTPASIGRNLLGAMRYGENVTPYSPQDLAVLVMGKGAYSFVGTKVFETGTFDRIRIEQGTHSFALKREPRLFSFFPFVSARGAPKFDEIFLFRIPVEQGIDVLAPWQLVVVGDGSDSASKRESKLSYTLPSQFVLPPAEKSAEEPLDAPWKESWRAQARNLVVLGVSLVVLTVLLVAMQRLTRHARIYEAMRIGFLLFTLVWLGWIAGAQLSIINVFAWISGLIHGNGVAVLLGDPLLCVLLAFVVVSFFIWGRGVFCGWLCPFGALQELLAKLARVARFPQWSPSFRTHRRLWPLKYVSLAVLTLAALHGLQTMAVAAEIEPFKTVISLRMDRTWPYVAFALVVLAAGLSVERAFCRFLCPLGAVMAIGGKLRLRRFTILKRRPECGSPCQLCAKRCPIQAIEPSGKINMDECFYCLDCQVVHNDATECPPLVYEAKRNRKFIPVATRTPAAE
ncbi:MAG TPA: 4Fe-4S binding protein [Burkholderiales bacterium]|nr:4Fe-4S binding protein [Burkholderiales bacterium]